LTYLIVPHEATVDQAVVWVGADEAPAAGLVAATSAGVTPLDAWQEFPDSGAPRLWFQRVTLSGLEPRAAYHTQLRRDREVLAEATVRTLPARIPLPGVQPFTVLLASCFSARSDQEGRLNATFGNLPEKPDVKILCGDQVYLDEPWQTYVSRVLGHDELLQRHFVNYWDTWAQPGGAPGCRSVLVDGANYFVADDHEFWNNAPNSAPYVLNSWTSEGREDWWNRARALYQSFQAVGTRATFAVGDLSFMLLETRLNRAADRSRLVTDEDLTAVVRWTEQLTGPGVLVVGQPIFAEKAGFWLGHLVDWGLPDYEQYPALARALATARHSVAILTGDVHFGRAASGTLPSGVQLTEFISSPTALAEFSSTWAPAPARFPAFSIPGQASISVSTEPSFRLTTNHFLTLEFVSAGADVQMTVRAWPVATGQVPTPIPVCIRYLR
jgi:hypothetical protein